MSSREANTRAFYDGYWPENVPDYRKTREHVMSIVPAGRYRRALDGGCGTGVCSLALAESADSVVGVDLSLNTLRAADRLRRGVGISNVSFCQGSILRLPFSSGRFDLVFSWGVIHHTVNPIQALDELVRVLRPGGTLVLAVYLKTRLTPLHETVRHLCLRLPRPMKRPVVNGFAHLVRLGERMGHINNVRDDNPMIESQIEDWFFVPEKHFFTIQQVRDLFTRRDLTCEVVYQQTGRFRSSSNFVVSGVLGGGEGNGIEVQRVMGGQSMPGPARPLHPRHRLMDPLRRKWHQLNANTIGSERYWWIALQNAAFFSDMAPLVARYVHGRTLDTGAGRLAWRPLLRRHSTSYVGGDLVREHPELDVIFDATRGLPFADGSFDTLFSCSVLEHTPEPWHALSEMWRVLAPGGTAIVSVPFLFYLHGEPHDYYRFTRYGIAHLVRNTGFQVVEMVSNGGFFHALFNAPSIASSTLLAACGFSGLIPPTTRFWLALAGLLRGRLERDDLFPMNYLTVLRKTGHDVP